MNQHIAKPFLKWAGGKVKLAADIASRIGNAGGCTYYEPFLGGASIFFELQTSRAVLSDENQELVNTYSCIQSQPTRVHIKLQALVEVHSSDNYYRVRELFNQRQGSRFDQAARFIYLNKAGFNGVYRVNRLGAYNVPSGKRGQLAIPTKDALVAVSNRLIGAALIHSDFELVVAHAAAGDVIYLDPPYPPISDSSFFTHYEASSNS